MRPIAHVSLRIAQMCVAIIALIAPNSRADDGLDENARLRARNVELQQKLDAQNQRNRLIALLDHEMQANGKFVRIHAAEALIAHGQQERVAKFFEHEIETTEAEYRIGVWRVMAKAAATEEARRGFVERIRRAMLDPKGPDRIHAAESLAKLGASNPEDRPAITQWIKSLDDGLAAFPRWLLVISSSPSERADDEANLAKLIESQDAMARLRSAYALGRLNDPSPPSLHRLADRLQIEPAESPARVYMIAALLLHTPEKSPAFAQLKKQLAEYLEKGKPNEQLMAATVIGMRGAATDLPALAPLLTSPQADARIGAALGSLDLLR